MNIRRTLLTVAAIFLCFGLSFPQVQETQCTIRIIDHIYTYSFPYEYNHAIADGSISLCQI